MIQISHLYKTYRDKVHVLKNLKLEISTGDFVYLMGPSGAGKTTLFRIMTGFERPSSGEVVVNNHNITKTGSKDLALFRRQIGVVFQDFKLLNDRTVYENVALPLQIAGFHRWDICEKVENTLARVGLKRLMNENPVYLSGGEKQRVAIARALVHQPKLIIADEPTGNLDWKIAEEIISLLKEANQQGTTILIATHDQSLIKQTPNCRLIQLSDGQIFESGETKPCGHYFERFKETGLSIL